ncbi:MAG: DUF3618 domain-containing protein [Tabrizicola sp.]|uniref:DUF3618 domain-containing protein n=1 Tax=Tabrizicola sp. TaxID=2005166 RepID=UPI0027357EC6|nr:DUF3618 domain-containing protein [Tabrizicola sp.]MDP3262893.1 DUF3618 domain-containing protein [Tabrizicola sp.]MDP3649090.1 DUF3618 domain-containing protein [Paracoccaceae bacterium]MDZ4065683.1 DUF3618 domain-containing protein [Tabrizicola sp.]
MTSDSRTPEDIERDIEREREAMRANINTLQRKFSMDGIMNDVSDMLRGRSSEIGRVAKETLGRNPAAVAMIGAGVAWLMLGKGGFDRASGAASGAASADRHGFGSARSGSSHRSTGSRHAMGGSGMQADDMAWLADDWDGDDDWNRCQSGGGITGAVKRGASSVIDTARDAVEAVRDRASRLTDRLSHGTEDLSDTARERVVSARRAAYDAQRTAREALRKGAHAATGAFENQPLVVGALAMAVGAGIGASLPRTRVEDRTLGSSSDTLVAEAQRIFNEEVHKARQSLEETGAGAHGVKTPDRAAGQTGGLVTPV